MICPGAGTAIGYTAMSFIGALAGKFGADYLLANVYTMKDANDLDQEIELDLERGLILACEILEVRSDASEETIRKQALHKFNEFHPDKYEDP